MDDSPDLILEVNSRLISPGNEPPERFIHEYAGTLQLRDINLKRVATIGEFQVTVLDVENAVNERESAFDVFDCSPDTMGYYDVLFDRDLELRPEVNRLLYGDEYGQWDPNTLILHRLAIERAYRGRGYGLQALQALIEEFRVGIGIIAMKPFPLQFEGGIRYRTERKQEEVAKYELDALGKDFRKARSKLRRYYRRLGFKLVPKTEYMVMSADDTANLSVPWRRQV